MTRRLLNVLTALSLLLCAAVLVLWVRSVGRWECVGRSESRPDHSYAHQSLNSSSGRVWFHGGWGTLSRDVEAYEQDVSRRRGEPWPRPAAWSYSSLPPRVPNAGQEFLGFHFIRTHDRAADGTLTAVLWVGVPHALPVALAFALPVARAGTRLPANAGRVSRLRV